MSMFGNLGRFGVTIRQTHARNKAIRAEQPAGARPEGHWLAGLTAQRPAGRAHVAASGYGALMTFADKCKLLGRRRGFRTSPAATSNRLRAALLPRR
ncbi:hypothetical protein [Mesorhizobium sp. AR02]|uniref:hypothetical protein n=1 Tax=Mesorhizobium sp. AR02 TaxID=2865837 RepID=UPI00215F5F5C|nr:hypothetical protein [Mesorhizobium sp. AR02]